MEGLASEEKKKKSLIINVLNTGHFTETSGGANFSVEKTTWALKPRKCEFESQLLLYLTSPVTNFRQFI